MARRRRNAVNCFKIMKHVGDKTYERWRAVKTFKYDPDLGYRPKPKYFEARTEAEAIKKRDAWKPESNTLDKGTRFLDYIRSEFVPGREGLAESGKIAWAYYHATRGRMTHYLLEPSSPTFRDLSIRKVTLAKLTPAVVEDFWAKVKRENVSPYIQVGLKADIANAIWSERHTQGCKNRIPNRKADYLENLVTDPIPSPRKKLFDIELLLRLISDESKPIVDRTILFFGLSMLSRPGEQWALMWTDVDFESNLVWFRNRTRRGKSGFQRDPGTKTEQEGEVSPTRMPARLGSMLREVRKGQMNSRTASTFVFQTEDGRPLNGDVFSNEVWPRIRKSLGLPHGPDFYSVKTLGNSEAFVEGKFDAGTMAARMRHKSTRMATEVYRRTLPGEDSVAQFFDRLLTERGSDNDPDLGGKPGDKTAQGEEPTG